MIRFYVTFLTLFTCLQSFASSGDTMEFFTNHRFEKCEKKDACFYRQIIKEGILKNVKDYYLDSKSLQMSGSFSDDSLKTEEGFFIGITQTNTYHKREDMCTVKK